MTSARSEKERCLLCSVRRPYFDGTPYCLHRYHLTDLEIVNIQGLNAMDLSEATETANLHVYKSKIGLFDATETTQMSK